LRLVFCQAYLFGVDAQITFALPVLMATSTPKVRLDQTLCEIGGRCQ
jgi:hypothetical protein